MSSKKIKFNVSGINGVGQRRTAHADKFNYYYKKVGIFGGLFGVLKVCVVTAGFMILVAAVTLTTNFLGAGQSNGMAMVFQSIEAAVNGPKYVDGISVENVPLKNEYLYAGGVEKEVLKLKFSSSGEIFRLKNLRVKVGGVDDSEWLGELVLKDGSGHEFRGSFEDDYMSFENLYFRIDDGDILDLSFAAMLPSNLHFGQRVYFEIENPSDIGLSLYGDDVNIRAAYPLRGAYFTVVARKMVF
jgi:hypothetical protein